MNIYLAARYGRREELAGYRKELEAEGFTVTSRWLDGGHDLPLGAPLSEHAVRLAEEDRLDLIRADTLIGFTEAPGVTGRNRGGRHVEFGYALGRRMRVAIVGPRENVFHYLPEVEHFADWSLRHVIVWLARAEGIHLDTRIESPGLHRAATGHNRWHVTDERR